MPNRRPRGTSRKRRRQGGFLRIPLELEHETSLYLLVSMLDLFMTVIVLNRGGFRERNPLALRVLREWGVHGMLVFKIALVTVICLVAQVIARYRPRTAQVVLNAATFATALVVIYTFALILKQLALV
mgnify:CR=1 FL=1